MKMDIRRDRSLLKLLSEYCLITFRILIFKSDGLYIINKIRLSIENDNLKNGLNKKFQFYIYFRKYYFYVPFTTLNF